MERIFNHTLLAIDDIKVKLLSHDVAVVHARMTLTDQTPAGAATPAGPRTMIGSFVVHRIVDRWLCASAQSTDVTPPAGTHVLGESGVFGMAIYPPGQVS